MNNLIRFFVFLVVLASPIAGFGAVAEPSAQPDSPYNFVVIVTDDQRWDSLWAMPLLQDRLVSRGVVFNNAYVSTPLCCPYRASFLAGGFYAHDTGVLENHPPNGGFENFEDAQAMSVILQDLGYQTAMIGKYMNGYPAPYVPPGWTMFEVLITFRAEALAEKALEFLDAHGQQPFFVYLAPIAPHYPARPVQQDRDAFPDFIYRERAYLEGSFDKPWGICSVTDQDEFHRDQLRTLQSVDRALAQIFDRIEDLGKLDSTVFIFTSDNGLLWGEHGLFGKGDRQEESIRVPLVISMPGIPPRVDEHLVVSNLDIPATILDMAGANTLSWPEPRNSASGGSSLVPILEDPQAPWQNQFLIEGYSGATPWAWAGIRHKDAEWDLKYVEYTTGRSLLFDLSADPYELDNRYGDPAYLSAQELMSNELAPLRGVAITTQALPDANQGEFYQFQLEAWGGDGSYTWSIAEGALPPGIVLDPQTGVLSGMASSAGEFTIWIRVEDTRLASYSGQPQALTTRYRMVVRPVALQAASAPESSQEIFTSIAVEDGVVIESANSNSGGSVFSTGAYSMALRIGDDDFDRQLKTIVSFDTSSIPDDAVIQSATLQLTRGVDVGKSAFRSHGSGHGSPYVDIKNGFFGNTAALEKSDFEAPADANLLPYFYAKGCQYDTMNIDLSAVQNFINTLGRTQIRLYFARDDDDDQQADYAGFYSSENAVADRHPRLIIDFVAPERTSLLGKPEYVPGQELGVYLWKETFDGPYHLRVSGDGPKSIFGVQILSDKPLANVAAIGLEANDTLFWLDNYLSFSSIVTVWEDGIDFDLPIESQALIAVEVDGQPSPQLLHVGSSGLPLAPTGWIVDLDTLPPPPDFQPGIDLGLFVGAGFSPGDVQMRWNGDGSRHTAELIFVSSGALVDVQPVSFEPCCDSLLTDVWSARVTAAMSSWWDGLDVQVPAESTIGIRYLQDGLFQPQWVNGNNQDLGLPNAYDLPRPGVLGDPIYDAAQDKGLFIWRSDDDAWHLRFTAGGDRGQYQGAVVSSLPIVSVQAWALESNDVLQLSADRQRVDFDLQVWNAAQDGIDMVIPEDAAVSLALNGDTAAAADLVRIGGERWPVERLPVVLAE